MNKNRKYKVVQDVDAMYKINIDSESKIIQELKLFYPDIRLNDVIEVLKELGYKKEIK